MQSLNNPSSQSPIDHCSSAIACFDSISMNLTPISMKRTMFSYTIKGFHGRLPSIRYPQRLFDFRRDLLQPSKFQHLRLVNAKKASQLA
jgi:hypothetical protein